MVVFTYATAHPQFIDALFFSSQSEILSVITHIGYISSVMELSLHKRWDLQDPIPVAAWTLACVLL